MSYNIEIVPALLLPFTWSAVAGYSSISNSGAAYPINNTPFAGYQPAISNNSNSALSGLVGATIAASGGVNTSIVNTNAVVSGPSGLSQGTQSIFPSSNPLYPLTQTGGLVFPYSPVITESIGIKYDTVELIHSNESVHAYKNTDNVRLTLSECVWTSETFDQAVYTLGVIHFFRTFSLMSFGRGTSSPSGQKGTGAPPSPMWFSAYGNFAYVNVPVIMERVEISWPNDIDYVGVPNPGTPNYNNQQLQYSTMSNISSQLQSSNILGSSLGGYTWVPIKLTIGSISLIVQHSMTYWTQIFNLNDFAAGKMVGRN